MIITAITNTKYNIKNSENKKVKNSFANVTFANNKKKYSKTEGLLKGFITGFTSFFGTLGLIVLVGIIRNKMK